jgi:hypothetical protein
VIGVVAVVDTVPARGPLGEESAVAVAGGAVVQAAHHIVAAEEVEGSCALVATREGEVGSFRLAVGRSIVAVVVVVVVAGIGLRGVS